MKRSPYSNPLRELRTLPLYPAHALLHQACLPAGLLFLSCGLDVIYSVDAPITTYHYPTYSSSDESSNYFDFRTVETSNNESSDFVFLGTAVYYKIYNSSSILVSQRSAITTVNTTSNGSAAATKMIQTYSYQPLGTNPNMSWSTFIPNGNSNRRVQFRLKNLSSASSADSWSTDTAAMICTNYENGGVHLYCGVSSSGSSETFSYTVSSDTWTDSSGTVFTLADKYPSCFVIPYRYDNERTFDFFDDDDSDDERERGKQKRGMRK